MWYGGVGLDHIAAKERGLTIPYESLNATIIPSKFKDVEHYWTGIYVNPLCFGSNMNRLEELELKPPTSWIAAISLIKGSPQLELAKKLYDWALSEKTAKLYAN